MRPWWEDALTADDRRVLDPGSAELDTRPDVLVVGGGVIGLATAVMCRRAGLGRVQVIERDRLAVGPSGSAAGGLSPGMHAIARPGQFGVFASESLGLHRSLDEEWGGALGLRTNDWLIVSAERIAPGSIDLPGVELLETEAVRELEPSLAEVGGAISVPAQSWVQPQRLAVEFARRAGGVATGVAMTGIEAEGARVASVATTAGRISPGALVIATGSAPPGLGVQQVTVKGHLLVTAPAPDPPRVCVAASIIVIPLPDGRLLAGGTFDHDDAEPVVRDHVVEQIRGEMARVIPSTADLKTDRAWCCFRPGTSDEMPVIDRLPGFDNAWLSVGHYRTGLLLAPASGRVIGDWIAGRQADGIDCFSLARFA